MENKIKIKGAKAHNLKNIDAEIPRNKFVVITGLSGSGKSSLAFDTIYAEGQRRYVESLSTYARQFLGVMDKPEVEQITGLSPAISIDQRSATRNPRSTVGTVTEIYDYLRLLFARVGSPHCPKCGRPIAKQSIDQITDQILELPHGTSLIILAPRVRDRKGEHKEIIREIGQAGYVRCRIDKVIYEISEAKKLILNKQKKHSIEVVVDRLILDKDHPDRSRLADSLETAVKLGDGVVILNLPQEDRDLIFSEQFSCQFCGINLPEIEPRTFSFNSPHGACPVCTGLGTKLEVEPHLVIPNKNLTLAEGAIKPWSYATSRNGQKTWYYQMLESLTESYGFSMHTPVKKLPKKILDLILYGTKGETVFVKEFAVPFEGVIPNLERRYKETESDFTRGEIEKFMIILPCPACSGKRLRPEALAVKIGDINIDDVVNFTIERAIIFFTTLLRNNKEILSRKEKIIARPIIKEILNRLQFLVNVGLDYLTLGRSVSTLAGGEAQRIRLATQIGSHLVGVLYILDEPSIGLHQRDNAKLIATLKNLRDLGNTVIVVEHDEETILSADYVLDMGPGAGEAGGKIVAQGSPKEIKKAPTLTGKYLSGRLKIEPPRVYRRGNGKKIIIKKAAEHNLKNIDVEIPLGKLVCITGVSGSGKSTLLDDILAKALAQKFHHAKEQAGKHQKIIGLQHLDKVINIDQSPIGRTPRSNPATYTGIFTPIRELFAATQEAQVRGYKAGRFSFNVKGGRCEVCQGDGVLKIEMQFLPDVYVECEECHGMRYNKEALEIEYKGKNIAEVLDMSVDAAWKFFANIPILEQKLRTLHEVGLGYMKLGQPATTLSGGEAQRIKLATELSRRATGKTLYILDEPTTGLHFDDVKRLLHVLQQLVDKGNSVVIIEHNLDVIKCADHIIDLGPEGGDKGGEIVAKGTPKEVARVKRSYTGQYLRKILNPKS